MDMDEIKCEQVGQLTGSGFTEMTGRVYSIDGLTPSIRTFSGGNTEVKIAQPIVYDMYNKKQITNGICGTITTNGNTSSTHCGTFGVLEKQNYRFFKQAFETLKENDCEVGDTIDAFNKKVNKDGVSPTITTRPEGFKTAILPITQDYRIRKLTERECFRLQGVKSEDFERIRYGKALPQGSHKKIANRTMTKAEWKACWRIMRHDRQSVSSCYHLAGDSIVTTCLMAIFGQLLGIGYNDKINELIGELKQ